MIAAIGTRMDQGRFRPLALFGLVVAYASLLIVSARMGVWLIDRSGLPIPTDFINVWAAGKLVMQGNPADAYDWTIHKGVEVIGAGRDFEGYFGWHYPPPFLLVAAALALMSYPVAMLAWMAASMPLYVAAIRLVVGRPEAMLAALAWPAVLWNVAVGQNGFLTAALLGGGLALIERRPAIAGILIGLLTYKPQFGLLIPLALLAGGHWRVFCWAAISAAGLAALSMLFMGMAPWIAFIRSIALTNDAVLVGGMADFSKLQSIYGYVRALDGSVEAAWLAHGILVASMAAGLAWLWHRKPDFDIRAAALAIATMLASPYVYVYDLVALAVPLAFLARTGFSRRETAAVVAAGALVLWGTSDHLPPGLLAMLLALAMVAMRVPWRNRRTIKTHGAGPPAFVD